MMTSNRKVATAVDLGWPPTVARPYFESSDYVGILSGITRTTHVRKDGVVELRWLDSTGHCVYATPMCHVDTRADRATRLVAAAYDRAAAWARRHGFVFDPNLRGGVWRRA